MAEKNGTEDVSVAEKVAAWEAVVQIERGRLVSERATVQQLAMELAIAQHRLAAAQVRITELEQNVQAQDVAKPDEPKERTRTVGKH